MLEESEKEKLFKEAIFESFNHHIKNNELFRNYCNNQGFTLNSKPKRLDEYPTIEECVHAILDDELDALQAKRKLVKDKYPKE